jgi:hypothetical protein
MANGPIYHPKVNQYGHGQHGRDMNLPKDAAKIVKSGFPLVIDVLKVAIDRAPRGLSISRLKRKH